MPVEQPPPKTKHALRALPWHSEQKPLMLAPLQGLTNRATRSLFIDWGVHAGQQRRP
jgi:hypothetical protein